MDLLYSDGLSPGTPQVLVVIGLVIGLVMALVIPRAPT
jgi:hypothetical protein